MSAFTKVCSLSEVPTGTTKYIELDGHAVLLANVEGELFAVYGKCSHYDLPLENAALCEHRIRCPFHHACFDLKSGKQLEAPGTKDLASYDVKVEEGQVYVKITQETHSEPVSEITPEELPANYIIGGGIAAVNAIIGMREAGFTGTIHLISKEKTLPYDRVNLSKGYLQGGKPADDLPIYPEKWYTNRGVNLMLDTEVLSVDTEKKVIETDSEERRYSQLLIATGGSPRTLKTPGMNLHGVHVIRNLVQAKAVLDAAKKASKAIVIGGGFIGLEVAMSLLKQDVKVTVIAPETTLFEKQWGARVGRLVQQLHEEAGITFQLGRKVAAIRGEASEVNGVEMDNGHQVSADLVVVGIGVEPATDFIAGLEKSSDKGLIADEYLSVGKEVFAAGDIVQYPDPLAGEVRIEHWKVAAQQGRVAGRNMAGAQEKYQMLPYFWSNQQGKNFRYAGHAENWDEITYEGKPEDRKFIASYHKNGNVMAVLGLGMDKELAALAEKMNTPLA